MPDFALPEVFEGTALVDGERWMSLVTAGVPHLVVRVDDIEAVEPASRGRFLRFHPALGAAGANVNFVAPEAEAGTTWLIRTYERGVEGETLACGTGALATGVALAHRKEATLPVTFRSRGGPRLSVRAKLERGRVSDPWLGGEGKLLFRGTWDPS